MTATEAITDAIYDAVLHGKRTKIDGLLQTALDAGIPPADIIQEDLRPAMDEVGTRFSSGEYFLPDLILSAETMKSAISFLRPLLTEGDVTARQEKIVIGTVQGDVHDIGKNLVIATCAHLGAEAPAAAGWPDPLQPSPRLNGSIDGWTVRVDGASGRSTRYRTCSPSSATRRTGR